MADSLGITSPWAQMVYVIYQPEEGKFRGFALKEPASEDVISATIRKEEGCVFPFDFAFASTLKEARSNIMGVETPYADPNGRSPWALEKN